MHRKMPRGAWDAYVRDFHNDKPGITEAVLTRGRCDDQTPYEWLTEGIADQDQVLDLACGSAPTRCLAGNTWIGLDASLAELAAAGADAAGHVVQGDLVRLPFRSEVSDVIICSMALMLIDPLAEALGEIRRVLHPGGVLRLLLPADGPLTGGDRAGYAALAVALGTTTPFPPSPVRHSLGQALGDAGLIIIADHARRFAYPIHSSEAAARLVDSLYLPAVSPRRRHIARLIAARWPTVDLGIPLRRVVATARHAA
jgi:SAM-dependent methyltransferase